MHRGDEVAREVPVILPGWLDAGNVAESLLAIPAIGVDAAGGTEATGRAALDRRGRPRKDPLRVALFAKRARAARIDLPVVPFRPTPVDQGLIEPDARGRWGVTRRFGGRFVPDPTAR